MTTEARLDLLETLATMQRELQEARDYIHELKRDGGAAIREREAQIATQMRRAEMWRERHDELGRALIFCGLMVVVLIAAHAWRSL